MTEINLSEQILAAFSAGFLTSLTPCVYPLIPITLALFGANDSSSRMRSLLLSLVFVAGIATTFTSLGLLAASTGALFGSALSHPVVLLTLGTLLILLALNSLDLLHFGFLHRLQGAASRIGGAGFLGAYFAGTAAGVVAATCVSPPLVAILALVAQTGDLHRGFWLLLAYSLGLGVLFVILGTFSGLVNRIPRSGSWMHGIKFFIATALFFAVLFLLQPFIPVRLIQPHREGLDPFLYSILGVGVVLAVWSYRSEGKKSVRLLSSTSAAISLFLLILVNPVSTKQGEWLTDYQQALSVAAETETPLMIDLYADWCAACKELDAITFADSDVMESLSSFTLVRLDLTTPTEEHQDLMERFGVIGLPWLLFLDSSGNEVPKSAVTGFLGPEAFQKHVRSVKETLSQ